MQLPYRLFGLRKYIDITFDLETSTETMPALPLTPSDDSMLPEVYEQVQSTTEPQASLFFIDFRVLLTECCRSCSHACD